MPLSSKVGAGAIKVAKAVVDVKAAKVIAAKKAVDTVTDVIDQKI